MKLVIGIVPGMGAARGRVHMRTDLSFDLAIIGDGITGLSAALHLQKLGASRICLLTSKTSPGISPHAAGLVSGGLLDNITRLAHRHGIESAAELWDWTETALDRLLTFAEEEQLSVHRARRVRWIINEDELKEALQAVKLFQQIGMPSELLSPEIARQRGLSPEGRSCSVQLDGTFAASLDPELLLKVLREKVQTVPVFGAAKSIKTDSSGVQIETESGTIRSEAVLVASHLATADLLPSLKPALVSYADQWHEFHLSPGSSNLNFPLGTLVSWRHGHYWGGFVAPDRVRLGGARFLRPLAGFEAKKAELLPAVESHLRETWNQLFPHHKLGETLRSEAGLDCWPSDELPLIGPMYGEPRVLLATGFMGQGLSMGFYAGCCLAELVQGLRPPLPRILWPERHRSLPQEA